MRSFISKNGKRERKEMKLAVKRSAQAVMTLLAIGFICYGAYRGEVNSVFTKAIRLCMECVGIG